MNKKLVFLLVFSLLFSSLFLTVSSEIVPEDNIVGETLIIEPDENFIEDNIEYGNPDDSYEFETDKIISFDKRTYVNKFLLPFIYIVAFGTAVYFVTLAKKKFKTKK